MAFLLNAMLIIAAAVYGPIPGNDNKSFSLQGNFPSYWSLTTLAHFNKFLARA